MIRTIEAVIDAHGRVQLLDPVAIEGEHRALVTILEEEPATHPHEAAVLFRARGPTLRSNAGLWKALKRHTSWRPSSGVGYSSGRPQP